MSYLQSSLKTLSINYPLILEKIIKQTPKTIIMMQYRPCFLQNSYQVYEAFDSVPGEGSSIEKLN